MRKTHTVSRYAQAGITALALALGAASATLPVTAAAAQQPPQCNAVTGCGTLLDFIKRFLKSQA